MEDGEKELESTAESGSEHPTVLTPARFYPGHTLSQPLKGLPLCVSSTLTRARGSKLFLTTNGLAPALPEYPWVPLSKHARALRLSEQLWFYPTVRSISVGFFHPGRIPRPARSSTRVEL
jgi:hypothetical protein